MSAYIPLEVKQRVRERFANCCSYCRTAENLTVVTFEIEHIVPLSAGGETAFENLCLSCPMCNRYKASLTVATDPVTQTETPLFQPQQQRWLDHFAWNENAT